MAQEPICEPHQGLVLILSSPGSEAAPGASLLSSIEIDECGRGRSGGATLLPPEDNNSVIQTASMTLLRHEGILGSNPWADSSDSTATGLLAPEPLNHILGDLHNGSRSRSDGSSRNTAASDPSHNPSADKEHLVQQNTADHHQSLSELDRILDQAIASVAAALFKIQRSDHGVMDTACGSSAEHQVSDDWLLRLTPLWPTGMKWIR